MKKKSKNSETSSPTLDAPSTPNTIDLEDNDISNPHSFERPIGKKAAKENKKKCKGKNDSVQNETSQILLEIRESQKQQIEDRKSMASKFLKIEKEREEREKRKDEREQMLYEEKILAMDTSIMDQYQVEYYVSLKEAIIEKRRKIGFTL